MYRNLTQLVDVRGQVKRNGSFASRSWTQITGIARHHSATTSGDAFSFANYHVNTLGWPGIGYHFVITKDGTIQWANSIDRVSYHVGNNNTPLIGICLVGNGSFTAAQEQSYFDLVTALRSTSGINVAVSNLRGHNEYPGHASNVCPGINMDVVRTAIVKGHPVGNHGHPVLRRGDSGPDVLVLQNDLLAAGESLPQFGADGGFGAETEEAVRSFQRRMDLTVDGVAGSQTWEALDRAKVEGRLVVVTAASVNVRSRPSFAADAVAGQVVQGEAFTVVEIVSVSGSSSALYRLVSGLYITTNENYVTLR
ncbi:N-acetyl-anhydromuramyl-L-alanine amidase AmpD [Sinobaca qinghaiensis]|uniref:N-acetyl-anhydromuramyl-L-alanine amidase AmpD n=1 Tax=Sinobaca qinghaiensis TaxID=342944 RepID=A0A419V5H7_9BACL|nr:peptidoglycan-binding protein [Sinobaca qinghaiensis]RKD73626.1 N-acetyl-anhydromuramyl-L-alanine amidase AmpD [Sinobaca qinghaiensis]